jgi:transposase
VTTPTIGKIVKDKQTIALRRVAFYHAEQDRVYEFISNNFELPADKIAEIYKQRWQIETLFKRLKQNFPLKYFLGDSANAIKIQVWICLIAQLILKLIQLKANRKWSFSTMASLIKFHLLSYIKLFEFLKNPHKNFFEITTLSNQTKLLFSG